MTSALETIRYHSGIAGEEVADMVDSLEREVSSLREQVERLTKERDIKEHCITQFELEDLRMKEQVERLTKENGRLRNALIGLVGSDSREELQSMELAMRIFPASDADVVASVNAIHALLETMQEDKP